MAPPAPRLQGAEEEKHWQEHVFELSASCQEALHALRTGFQRIGPCDAGKRRERPVQQPQEGWAGPMETSHSCLLSKLVI